ncbi:MAG: 3-oxoacyl-[acyl-carrier-protein] synthase III C-terminal domain-containing protein [Enhygromyxa sp.]
MIPLYLSAPGVVLPEVKWTNQDQLARVRARFRGTEQEWEGIRRQLQILFRLSNSRERYHEPEPHGRLADYAVTAAQRCLERVGLRAEQLDLVINGSIAREYFEPATAMEISAKLGLERVHAFDVTSACAGLLEAVHVAAGLMHINPELEHALVCAADLTTSVMSLDIQNAADIATRGAGLTIGDGAAALVLSRAPLRQGGRVLGISSTSLPQHHHLCSAPVDGSFTSHSAELFKLGEHVPGHVEALLRRCDKTIAEVDHWVCHQPSDSVVRKLMSALGVELERVLLCHELFGNTVNSTVPMTLDLLLRRGRVAPGELLLLSSAAAGFTMVSLLLEWNGDADDADDA